MLDTEEDPISPKRRRRKKKKRRKDDLLNIPGVRKIVMTELTQKIVECVVGEHVSSENPWKYVRKDLIQDNLELHEESSEFLPIRKEIIEFARPEMLIGYIADETQDKDDEFYICVTEEATDTVQKIIEKLKQEQEYRLHYQLYKDIHEWHSMGTEEEVDEAIIKNNRPLIEVEVETQYPIFPGKVQFRLLRAEQKRDGYMELRCAPEENLVNVYMKRIDSCIQVAPAVVETEAQTICTYPKNSATQYLYDVGETDDLFAKCERNIVDYADSNIENLSDLLRVNGSINLYADDFDSLVFDPTTKVERVATKEFMEYMFFMDVNLCKGKMISDAHWHPMLTGTVAISYSDIAANIFYYEHNKDDVVYKAVHDVNPVLIWSLNEDLKPKLILETPREIQRVLFCKFDENILIGGCKNGQIVIWDIRNKLQKVEEKEVLTTAQQKYRSYMHSLMGWMKNIHDISFVRPAAVSDLRYSHKASVTGISWMDPFFEFTRTGNLIKLENEEGQEEVHSMQLLTCGLDGTILIWDLKKKPVINPGGYKPKKLKRLKKRPSALEVDVSPYRVLHLNLKPIYKINVARNELRKDNRFKPVSITRFSTGFCWLKYKEANPDKTKKFDIRERLLYKPILSNAKSVDDFKLKVKIGSAEGDFAEISWDGQDFDSGEVVNAEMAKYIYDGRFHDGSIVSIQTSPSNRTTLTVGGKIFALWRRDFPRRPIVWRRSRHMFTRGEWNPFQTFKIVLHDITGVIQKWIFPINSKECVFEQVMSNSFLTAAGIHPFQMEKNIYGIGDEQGAFRLFFLPADAVCTMDQQTKDMMDFIDREVNRKTLFLQWQDEFNKKNKDYLRMKQEAEERAREEEAAKQAELAEEKPPERAVKKGPQPGKYIEWIKEQRQITEEARIKAMIINKKQLDTKELEKRRKPLQKLDEENERKKRKQKERLKQGENIFRETVASLFPDVMREKPVPPPDPYAGGDPISEKKKCFFAFNDLEDEYNSFILEHPYQYDFSFKKLLLESKIQKRFEHPHTMRFEAEMRARKGEDSVISVEEEVEDQDSKEVIDNADEEEQFGVEEHVDKEPEG